MLSPVEIGEALAASLGEGASTAIVSLMARDGQPLAQAPRMLIREGEAPILGTLGDKLLDAIAAQFAVEIMKDPRKEILVASAIELAPGSVETQAALGNFQLLFEIARPTPELIVCGGGHVGKAIVGLARLLDYQVTVVDDRPEFSSRERFPDPAIRLITDDFARAFEALKITKGTALVIVTRGHRHDEICLQQAIRSAAPYVGMIGSRRRVTTIREHLQKQGISAEHLRRVRAPIGLDIGAMTPEEIAVAILAEMILARRGGTGIPKSQDGPMPRTRERAGSAG